MGRTFDGYRRSSRRSCEDASGTGNEEPLSAPGHRRSLQSRAMDSIEEGRETAHDDGRDADSHDREYSQVRSVESETARLGDRGRGGARGGLAARRDGRVAGPVPAPGSLARRTLPG